MENFIKSIDYKIVEDSNEAYHSKTEYIGASGLKLLKISPAHFKERPKKEPTDAMLFGSAYHTLVLEQDKFDSEYYVYDESDIIEILISEGAKSPRATDKYKDWFFEQESIAGGKKMIDNPTYEKMKFMKSKLTKHFYCNSLLKGGNAEVSIYCELTLFDDSKVKVQIRPDKLNRDKKMIVDLKTTNDLSEHGFTKNAANFDYHIQAALYTMIMSKIDKDLPYDFVFIAQEKSEPYAFNMFDSSVQFLSQGIYECENLLMLYQLCLKKDWWPGYQVWTENKYGIIELKLPNWAIREINYYDHGK